MKIGIDIDNTITDTLPILKKYCQKYHNEILKKESPINQEGFATYNLYDWTEKEEMNFCQKYLEKIALQTTLKENAKEIIKKLKEEGNIIYIITARDKPHYAKPYEITQKFLLENGIVYDELFIGITEKKQLCIDKHIDIMIDDEPQNIIPISNIIPVIAFEETYNKKCTGDNIIKVNNWNEVYDFIKKKGDYENERRNFKN